MINSGLPFILRANSLLNTLRKLLSLPRIFKGPGCGIVRADLIYNLFVYILSPCGNILGGYKSSTFYIFCLYTLSTSQVPEDLMQWCVHKVIAELILWFLPVDMLMFAVMTLLLVGLVQPFLPLFWWLYLCYEAHLICSPQDVPFGSIPDEILSHLMSLFRIST